MTTPRTSALFPHTFTMGGDRVKDSVEWCKDQGLVNLKDYLVVWERNTGYVYFKESQDAMLFKLSRSGKV